MEIRFSYNGVPTLRRFAESNAFLRAIVGPIGGGKSSASVVEFPRRAMAQKPGKDGVRRTRWVVIRNTFPELRDTTIRTFHQWLPPEHFGRWYAQDHRYVIKAFKGCEFEILFRALDKPDDIKKLLSLDITGGWINEVREIPWAIVDALQGRCGRYPAQSDGGPTWFGLWMDTNPPDTDSTFYKFFEDGVWQRSFEELRLSGMFEPGAQASDFAAIFHQPSGLSGEAENVPNLPPGYYPRLCVGKSKEWIKVYVNGEYGFVSDDRRVYTEYSDEAHLRDNVEPISGAPIYRGWDFGLTPACSFSQLLPDGHWLIFDEMISEEMGIDRFSDEVLAHCSRSFKGQAEFEDYGDPAGSERAPTDEKTCFQIMQAKGIDIQPGLQSVAIRLESVRKPLRTLVTGKPQFILHKRCKTLRKAMLGGYHFKRLMTKAERYTTKPDKNHPYSDIMNCVEYTGTILFGAGLTDSNQRDDFESIANRAAEREFASGAGRSKVTGY